MIEPEKPVVSERGPRSEIYTLIIAVLILVVVVLMVLFFNKPASSSSATPQLKRGQWAVASLNNGIQYYGRLAYNDELNSYVMWNVWVQANSIGSQESTAAPFARVGDEIYKPEPYMVINPSSLHTWQNLSSSSPVITEIKKMRDYKEVTEPNASDIEKARYSAVFMSNNSALFGTLLRDGDHYLMKNAYLITRKDQSSQNNVPVTSLADLQMISQKDVVPGSVDPVWLNAPAIVMYQTLSKDSPVTTAIQNR
jgi:hypothetical protein